MTTECFHCRRDVREKSFCYLESSEMARFLALCAGNKTLASGLGVYFECRARELTDRGLLNAAEWATQVSGALGLIAEAEWVEQPTAEMRELQF